MHRQLSQTALGKRAGLHRTYVSEVECGHRNLSLHSMASLAEALEISIPALFQPPQITSPDLNFKKAATRRKSVNY
jgi:transcriptional regulator with XRE-family HTH domain